VSEKTAYRNFRDNVTVPGDRINRIENLIGLGFPDTNGCFNGVEFWMEIKAPSEPARKTTALFGSNHKLSQDQRNWFLTQKRAMGKGFVYIETNYRRMLITGMYVDYINVMTVDSLMDISIWSARRPTVKKDWYLLRERIIKGV